MVILREALGLPVNCRVSRSSSRGGGRRGGRGRGRGLGRGRRGPRGGRVRKDELDAVASSPLGDQQL